MGLLQPRWVYNDGSPIDYSMSIAQRPWDLGSRALGGSDNAAGGVPSAYEIRRDYLMHLTLRFPVNEWDDVERLVRHLQRAGSATFYPDQDDTSVAHTVYGEAPALGEEIRPRRDSAPSFFELNVSIRRTTEAIFTDPYFGDLLFHWRAGTTVTGSVFTRSSTAYYVDRAGVLQVAAANEERTEWVGAGFATPTLLLEDARTNLHLRSEDITTSWPNFNSNDTADAVAAPDGATTADKLYDDSTPSTQHYINQSVTKAASSLEYAFTVFVKAAEYTDLQIHLTNVGGSSGVQYNVDLSAGTIAFRTTFGSGWTAGDARITALANGWYRCELNCTSDTSTTVRTFLFLANAPDVVTYDGDGASGLYLWGMQLEQAAFASSYIQTVASSVTRAAETMNFPFLPPPQEMTPYVKFIEAGTVQLSSSRVWQISDNADADAKIYLGEAGGGGVYRVVHDPGSGLSSSAAAAPSQGDTVELRTPLAADGAVTLGQSINGAVEAVAAASAANAPASAWSDQLLWVNQAGSGARGFSRFLEIKIARGTKTMAQMRALVS